MFDGLKNLDLNTLPADARATILDITKRNTQLTENNASQTAQVGELAALDARLEHFVQRTEPGNLWKTQREAGA
jgi:hypothetical protein